MGSRSWAARVGAVALLPALLALASCGDDDGDSDGGSGSATTAEAGPATTGSGGSTDAGAATTAPSDVDPDGVLRIGYNLAGSGGIFFDPVQQLSPADFQVHYHVYDTLLRQREDGTYAPGLATEARVVDPQTIEVTLQEGVMFQDGTPFEADDVAFTIERNIASQKTAPFRISELAAVASVDVESPTELTIRLSTPTAGSFYNLLAHNETMPVSKDAVERGVDLNTNPVGAGPFKLVSQDAQRIVLEKWDGYFQADEIKVKGVEWVQADPASLITALRSGAVDVANTTADQNEQLAGSGLEARSVLSPNSVYWLAMQCDVNPALGDARVRQALNFATDRDAVNATAFYGKGHPMSQFWAPGNDFYDPSLEDVYTRDVAKAKQLLADAGYTDLALTLIITPGQAQRVGEILQGQWGEAGISLDLVPTTNITQDFFIDHKTDLMAQPQSRFWTDKITRTFVPGSIGTTCDPRDPEFTAMVAELRALDPDDPRAVEVWQDINRFIADHALAVFLVNGTLGNAYDPDRVGNPAWTPNQLGNLFPDMHQVYVKG